MNIFSKKKLTIFCLAFLSVIIVILGLSFSASLKSVYAETIANTEIINEEIIESTVDKKYYGTIFYDIEALDGGGFVSGGRRYSVHNSNTSCVFQVIDSNYKLSYEQYSTTDTSIGGKGISAEDLVVDSDKIHFVGNGLLGTHILNNSDEEQSYDSAGFGECGYIAQTGEYSFAYATKPDYYKDSKIFLTPNLSNRFITIENLTSISSLQDGNLLVSTLNTLSAYSTISTIPIWTKTFPNTTINKILVENGCIFVVGNTTNTTDKSLAFTNGGQDGIIIKLNNKGDIIDSATYGSNIDDTFYQSNIKNERIVVRVNEEEILIINTNTLSTIERLPYTLEGFRNISAIAIDEKGVVALTGCSSAYQYEDYGRVLILETLTSMGLSDKTIGYHELFTPYDGISALLSEVTIDEIEGYNADVFNTTVGNHDLNYSFHVTNDNGTKNYNLTRRITVEPYSSIEKGAVFDGGVTLDIRGGTATLNGEPFERGSFFELPGNHEIRITGINGYEKIIPFTINLSAQNVDDAGVYYDSVTPVFKYGTWTLNGNPFVSGTEINTPGNYILSGTAINGLTRTYEFTVEPTDVYVTNGITYFEPIVVADTNGTLKLNGEDYIAGTELNASGDYVFEIFGASGYYKKWEFWLAAGSDLTEGETYVQSKTIHFVGTATLDGVPITTGFTVTEVGNHEFILKDGDFNETVHFAVVPDYSVYEDSIYLTHTLEGFEGVSSLTVDGQPQANGFTINEVGNHTLVIFGVGNYSKTVEFSILPEINVKNSAIYEGEFDLIVQGGTATLNGVAINSQEQKINQVGNYQLVISGVNDYSLTVGFTIKEKVTGFVNGGIYIATQYPTINIPNAKLMLNGESIVSGAIVKEVGNHTLKVIGLNEYIETYTFTVKEADPELAASYIGTVTPNIPNAILFLNEKEYTNGTPIQTVGNHILKVIGIGGYESYYSFTVTECVGGIVNEEKYEFSVTPVIENATLKLDGEDFISGTTIYTVGNHTLTVIGIGGYKKDYTFTVTEILYGLMDGAQYDEPVAFTFNNITLVTVNEEEALSGITYSAVGKYTVVVQGVNGYANEYTFEIGLKHNLTDGGVYEGFVYPSINALQLKLNGEDYDGTYAITEFGNYQLQIFGAGGYTNTFTFTVTPIIRGVENNGVYESAVVPVIENAQTLFLNDEAFSSGSTVDLAGNYVLQINGVGGFVQTLTFTVKPVLIIEGTFASDAYNEAVKFYCSNASLKINGEDYEQGTAFTVFGTHILELCGVGGYFETQIFRVVPVIRGVQDGGVYNSPVTPNIENIQSLLLDDEIYINQTPVTKAGKHTLTIFGTRDDSITIQFTIEAQLQGIMDGGNYEGAVDFNSNADVYINGAKVQESFNLIGNHTVVLKGVGGYESEPIKFTINPSDINIENGGMYNGAQEYSIVNAKGVRLNGVDVATAGTATSIGINTLEIFGVGNYKLTYTFTILPNIEDVVTDFIGSASFVIGGVTLKVDGNAYNAGEIILTIGNHSLMILGCGGYEQTIDFVIRERSNIENGVMFYGDATVNIENAEALMLNGKAISNGLKITKIGNHTLKVVGTNGYENIYTFTIKPVLEINEGEKYNRPFILQKINGELILNDKAINSDIKIDKSGKYTLVIRGEGNYTETITFEYRNPNVSLVLFIGIPVLAATVAITVFIIIKRRQIK